MKSIQSRVGKVLNEPLTGIAGLRMKALGTAEMNLERHVCRGGAPTHRAHYRPLMTQTLVKLAPSPVPRMVGTLSPTQTVLRALGLAVLAS